MLDRNHKPACIILHISVGVQSQVPVCWRLCTITWAWIGQVLTSSYADWNSSDRVNSFLLLNKGLNGDRRLAMVLLLDESRLKSPMKDRIAVRLEGWGS